MYESSRSSTTKKVKKIARVTPCSFWDCFKLQTGQLPIGRVEADHQELRSLQGNIVLVTGGSRGIGKAICERFASAGCTVIGTSRNPEKVDNKPTGYTLMQLDVRSAESINACVQRIIDMFGHIDILVNNAGIGQYGRLITSKIKDWTDVFQTNVFGVHQVTQAVYPHMNGKLSRIITIGSLEGETGYPYQALYAMSKRMLQTWNDSFDFEQRKHNGPSFTLLEPAWVKTDFGISHDIVNTEPNSDDPYVRLAPKMFIQNLQQYGIEPAVVAQAVFTIAALPRPKLRYYVGLQGRFLMGYNLEDIIAMVYTQPPEQILAFMDTLAEIMLSLNMDRP
jgi:NAD(P)-dependent dehydrogenase (short-subunit alcohol dehydrogenase family)